MKYAEKIKRVMRVDVFLRITNPRIQFVFNGAGDIFTTIIHVCRAPIATSVMRRMA